MQHAAQDARELIRLEINLARNEVTRELVAVKSSGILVAISLALGLTGLASLVTALGIELGARGALAVGLLLLLAAAISGSIGYRRFPKSMMAATGLRLKDDEAMLKDHLS
jgi:hypothetical protein